VSETKPSDRPKGGFLSRLPILVILVVAVVGTFLLRDQLSFEALARHRDTLIGFRDAHYLASVAGFMLAYMAVVAFSLPGATVFTLTGGFLFGLFPGVLYNVVAATLGAIGIFLAARTGYGARFASLLQSRGGPVARLQEGLRDNEWSVLFLMRLAPVLPFFLANLIPAFLNVRLSRFAITTFFGIMPGGLVLTSVGTGLGAVLARGEAPDLSILFTPMVLFPILGLAALSALPILIKYFRRREV
jgi:uncharacterized membrane protein YdjX (TVP38/TMEM64 family)